MAGVGDGAARDLSSARCLPGAGTYSGLDVGDRSNFANVDAWMRLLPDFATQLADSIAHTVAAAARRTLGLQRKKRN
jgi:hypothetical protein